MTEDRLKTLEDAVSSMERGRSGTITMENCDVRAACSLEDLAG